MAPPVILIFYPFVLPEYKGRGWYYKGWVLDTSWKHHSVFEKDMVYNIQYDVQSWWPALALNFNACFPINTFPMIPMHYSDRLRPRGRSRSGQADAHTPGNLRKWLQEGRKRDIYVAENTCTLNWCECSRFQPNRLMFTTGVACDVTRLSVRPAQYEKMLQPS